MPSISIEHQWVAATHHGNYISKCQQCGQKTFRPTNATEECDGCTPRPVLCSLTCFEKWHNSYGFDLIHYVREGQKGLPKALLRRELGNMSHSGLCKLLTIRSLAFDHRIIQSSSDDEHS